MRRVSGCAATRGDAPATTREDRPELRSPVPSEGFVRSGEADGISNPRTARDPFGGAPESAPGPAAARTARDSAAARGEAVSTDRLIDALWGEMPPDGAGKALSVRVSQLRKLLEAAGETGTPS